MKTRKLIASTITMLVSIGTAPALAQMATNINYSMATGHTVELPEPSIVAPATTPVSPATPVPGPMVQINVQHPFSTNNTPVQPPVTTSGTVTIEQASTEPSVSNAANVAESPNVFPISPNSYNSGLYNVGATTNDATADQAWLDRQALDSAWMQERNDLWRLRADEAAGNISAARQDLTNLEIAQQTVENHRIALQGVLGINEGIVNADVLAIHDDRVALHDDMRETRLDEQAGNISAVHQDRRDDLAARVKLQDAVANMQDTPIAQSGVIKVNSATGEKPASAAASNAQLKETTAARIRPAVVHQ